MEITCDIIGKDGFTYNWGINYGDPKVKGTKKPIGIESMEDGN